MVPPLGHGSHISKTYGKRSGLKRKQTNEMTSERRDIDDTSAATAKRRRRSSDSTEVVEQTPSPAATELDDDVHNEISHLSRPPVRTVYGTPRKTTSALTARQSPSKPARDLTLIFDDVNPSKHVSTSPSKLAKRMLSRSKTETSVQEDQSSRLETKFERTPSLPNLPSPSKREEPITPSSKTTASILLPTASSSNMSVTRTYAGKFRSFLVPLHTTSSINDPLSTAIGEEEMDIPESYTSLRNRWGVDNSEDDPYPYMSPSPSKSAKSNYSTPDASPSRHGRRKGKAASSGPNHPISIPDLMNVKTISELRNQGENRRFFDEVGYLFEGMDKAGGLGLRRASALEITTKLCDPEFTRKAKAADFFTKTWDVFLDAGAGKGEDKLLDIILAFFVALVARDPTSLADLVEHATSTLPMASYAKEETRTTFVGIIFRILEKTLLDCDPLRLVNPNSNTSDFDFKKGGVGKDTRSTFITVYKTISSKSKLFSSESQISTSLLISYTLQSLSPLQISTDFFPSFLTSLRPALAPQNSISMSSALSLHWKDAAESICYETIYYHLRLLDTYLLGQWVSPGLNASQPTSEDDQGCEDEAALEQARDNWLVDDLISLAMCVELCGATHNPDFSQVCIDITLRILVSVTHANELWARKVLNSEYTVLWLLRLVHKCNQRLQKNWQQLKTEQDNIKLEDQEDLSLSSDDLQDSTTDGSSLDTLCLVLGLLTNLVQTVKDAKCIVHDIRLNPTCNLQKRACARKCVCSHSLSLSGIEILAQLYSSLQKKTESMATSLDGDTSEARAEADASFLRGHLSVLFGLLMMDSPENQSSILAALPTVSSTKSVKNVTMAKKVTMERLVEQAKDFATFYAVVSKKLGGDTNSKAVRDVVAFLEKTRDSSI